MLYILLGRTGVKVSSLCLGTSYFADPTPEKECMSMVIRAIEAGINPFVNLFDVSGVLYIGIK